MALPGMNLSLDVRGRILPPNTSAPRMGALKASSSLFSRLLCSSSAAFLPSIAPGRISCGIFESGSQGRWGIAQSGQKFVLYQFSRDFSSASSRRWFRRKGKKGAALNASTAESQQTAGAENVAKKSPGRKSKGTAKPEEETQDPQAVDKKKARSKVAVEQKPSDATNATKKKKKNESNATKEDDGGKVKSAAKTTKPKDAAKLKPAKEVKDGGDLKEAPSKRSKKKAEVVAATTIDSTIETGEQENGAALSGKVVVVVESPAKAKTIEKYLGENYVVVASYGHVRDLAARSGSVRPQDDFDLVWEVPDTAKSRFNQIKTALKGAQAMVLASDPDREGEAIAWHILEMIRLEGIMKKGLKIQRVTFNEITKTAVQQGMKSPRNISQELVDAYLARRALDYLIGFDISPLLWRKLPGSKSAGRVQSAALCLLADREKEIESFTPREYWTVEAEICPADSKGQVSFPARLVSYNGVKLDQFSLTGSEAEAAASYIGQSSLRVDGMKNSVIRRNAPGPYITSSLQQDASSKLGFGASKTMLLAQKLYEGVKLPDGELVGLITYMRTDSMQLSAQAIESIRKFGEERYGKNYVLSSPRKFSSKVKNAQEAHEAIRPTGIERIPSELAKVLEQDALRLYALIWRRTMACQLEQAVFNHVSLDVEDPKGVVRLRSTASTMEFPGFQIVYRDKDALAGDNEEEESATEKKLPSLKAGSCVSAIDVKHKQHFTEPPPRYTEGSLVKKMEELGIGRPSTYAHVLKTLQLRQYMQIEKQRIIPRVRGRMVAAFLSRYFTEFVDYGFTAKMEEQLDAVSSGSMKWKEVLQQFWPNFHDKVTSTAKVPTQQVADMLASLFSDKLAGKDKTCPNCHTGELQLKLTKFGTGYFLGCNRYPSCHYSNSLDKDEEEEEEECGSPVAKSRSKVLGVDSSTGLPVLYKEGPYGDYVQIGEDAKGKLKPKRVRVPESINYNAFTLEMAMELMKYPKELGVDPEGKPVMIGIGRFGCYIRREGYSVYVPKDQKVEELTLEMALDIFVKGKEDRRKVRKSPVKIAFA
ncbi:uncharacterized protein LOC9639009 [Selaginella moellendorffii]|nr:uncharacterized protein LOC9639009 [Selaginella moellendorffii]|eukprot:XP_002988753.2 uncharacterized protein LOC9639009 [Selaginella moellendorffii]